MPEANQDRARSTGRRHRVALAALVLAMGGAAACQSVQAMMPAPAEPTIDCRKKKNKKKPECQQNQSGLTDEQIYQAGYWLARDGKYADAIELLKTAKNQDDPRILNYLGFATRKLGDVATAMTYYARALALNPDYTVSRAYLGEAFLERGDVKAARVQLAEIERRCGADCVEFGELSRQIASYEATGRFEPQTPAPVTTRSQG